MMYGTLLLSSTLFVLHAMGTPQFFTHHGRRVCGWNLHHHNVVMTTESYVQPVHKPYITLCQGHRLCSTYKTTYSLGYRQVSRAASPSHFYPECCPGWQRLHSHHCNQATCAEPCVNGGTCLKPNRCACPLGWKGPQCQTDVDECSGRQRCSQECVNTAGSYRCACRDGFRLAGDGCSCQSLPSPPPPPPPAAPAPSSSSQTTMGGHAEAAGQKKETWPASRSIITFGTRYATLNSYRGSFSPVENVTEEVQSLRNRVELLEKKLQLALAPFSSFFPLSTDEGLSEKTTLLSHSFQQLDRIDSLSEQIGFLEERLGTCSCRDN